MRIVSPPFYLVYEVPFRSSWAVHPYSMDLGCGIGGASPVAALALLSLVLPMIAVTACFWAKQSGTGDAG